MTAEREYLRPLAELAVRFGANVQPGQLVAVGSAPGKEELARAVAEVSYERGAKFVEVTSFDVYVKRARILHADPATLDYVPPWFGRRMLDLGELRCARIGLLGPVAPHALEGLDPALIGRDLLPAVVESAKVLNARTTNWTGLPGPNREWAKMVYPDLDSEHAYDRLWEQIAHVCRLDEPDPAAAWTQRFASLESVSTRLTSLALDAVRLEGPGTSLTVGLLPAHRWLSGRLQTVDGIVHAPNLPTEEVFTTPDPTRTEGTVMATKPLRVAGTTIEGLRVRFEGGRAVSIDADRGAETLRTMAQQSAGGDRLGEIALVDREGRIGPLKTVFYETLLDENAASHIALGQGLAFALDDEQSVAAMNHCDIHTDFMIGSDEVAVTGVRRDGGEVPLLRGGTWQI
jgi:aminopeptidase